ncbi:MAG: type VI secretion system-associated protein TagF, partial [Inquilinus sp.]|nr:type VI secretion system-associated protein TagF [Inquilinus sp.]
MSVAVTGADAAPQPGLHGKVPSKGDFLTRRLPRGFVEPWDQWLQSAINCSKEQLEGDWLPTYLTSPLWRFVLSPGLCGPDAVAGVLMPSVDRGGRYFPFTVAGALPGCTNPAAVPVNGEAWFKRAEAMALTALEDDFDLERFDSDLAASAGPAYPRHSDGGGLPALHGLRVGLDDRASAAHGFTGLVDRHLQSFYPQYSLWWSAGSDSVEPSLIACNGLP